MDEQAELQPNDSDMDSDESDEEDDISADDKVVMSMIYYVGMLCL